MKLQNLIIMNAYPHKMTFCLFLFFSFGIKAQQLPCRNIALSIEEQAGDLLQRMTLDEKIAQIRHIHSWDIFNGQELDEKKLATFVDGKCWGFVEGFPLTGENCRKNMRRIQEYMLKNTRLGIPCFTIAESLHGSVHEGSTIFPQNIALGSTFNTELAYLKASFTASELHAQGMKQVLSPCIDVVRDLRWGRVEESYGEDPFLCGIFGQAEVKGYLDHGISPMLKHFGPHGNPLGGLNLASVECSLRDLHEVYLKSFEMVIKTLPVQAVMSTYNSYNRIPNSASHYLLTEILREQWGFQGYVYSDWGAIDMLKTFHHTAKDSEEAAIQALTAGLDSEASSECYPSLKEAVEKGKIKEEIIDDAVRRVLLAKFRTGLFDDPFGDQYYAASMRTPEAIALSRKIANESTVLLKNERNMLPLDKDRLESIAIIGPNADQVQFGDYSWSRNNKDGVTPLTGIRQLVKGKATLHYAQGCDMASQDTTLIASAVEAARNSEVAIVFCGSASAPLARSHNHANCGEGFDLHDLSLPGAQEQLIRAVYATGTPTVLVLVSGKPFILSWEKEHLPAILAQWYAGEQEGNSIAEILFGRVNPSGHLTFSFPQSTGHLPAYYNHLPSDKGFYQKPGSYSSPGRDYVFASPEPLWAFGHGLSYTEFSFSSMQSILKRDTIHVKAIIRNVGSRKGKEVIQLYVRDMVSSVVTPVKQLKAFCKVELNPDEQVEVQLQIPTEELTIWTEDGKRLLEPGAFELQLGNASDHILLSDTVLIGEQNVKSEKKREIEVHTQGKEVYITGVVRDVQATVIDRVEIYLSTDMRKLGETNKQGEYSIKISQGARLLFRKKGYLEQAVPATDSVLNIKMTYGNS